MNIADKQIQPNSNKFPQNWINYLWKFSRPHTIIGTSLSVLALYLISLENLNIEQIQATVINALITWLACICGNIYIVGLNQIQDIEIDKINKPSLPIAAGELTPKQAQIIVLITGILALVFAALGSPFLLGMVSLSLIIGTCYSQPPVRLKRFPFWASFCIFTVRGIIVNLGLSLHFNSVLKKLAGYNQINQAITTIQIPASVWLLTLFILLYTFAIAILKDIPDIEGDKQYQISTFTLKMGAKNVLNLATIVISISYILIALLSFIYLATPTAIYLSITHILALALMFTQSQKVNLEHRQEVAQFYQFIWKLFFLEYLIFPAGLLISKFII